MFTMKAQIVAEFEEDKSLKRLNIEQLVLHYKGQGIVQSW